MTFLAKAGTFTTPVNPGTLAVTGVGFTPKAIIFKLTHYRTTDDTHVYGTTIGAIGWGYSGGASDNACSWGMQDDNDANSQRSSTYCLMGVRSYVASPSQDMRGKVTSFDSDGFTLDFDHGSGTGDDFRVDYLALGGTDITGASTFAFDDKQSTGNVAVTGVGFEPKFIMFSDSWAGVDATLNSSRANSSTIHQLSIATADASVSIVTAIASNNTASGTLMTSMRTDAVRVYGHIFSSSPLQLATLSSMDSDGFTINYSVSSAVSYSRCVGIAIGGDFDVVCGTIDEPSATGLLSLEVPFVPRGAVLFSQGRVASTSMFGNTTGIEVDPAWGIWAADGGHFSSSMSAYQGGGNAWFSARTDGDAFEILDQTSSGGASVVTSFDLDDSVAGNAFFNFTAVSGNEVEIAYLMFGASPSELSATKTYLDLDLPMTNSAYMAQRLAYRRLLQSQRQRVLALPVNLRAMRHAVGDVLTVTIDDLSISADTYRVAGWRRSDDGSTIEMTLREDDEAAYADPTVTQYRTVAALPTLTAGTVQVPPPTALAAAAALEGIQLTWTAPDNLLGVHHYAIYSDTDSSWSGAALIGTTLSTSFLHTLSSTVTRYYWVRAVDAAGYESTRSPDSDTSTVTATYTAGTIATPSAAQSLGGIDGTPATGQLTGVFKRAGVTVASRVFTATHSGGNLTVTAAADTGEATTYTLSGDGTPTVVVTQTHTGSGTVNGTLTFTVAP